MLTCFNRFGVDPSGWSHGPAKPGFSGQVYVKTMDLMNTIFRIVSKSINIIKVLKGVIFKGLADNRFLIVNAETTKEVNAQSRWFFSFLL